MNSFEINKIMDRGITFGTIFMDATIIFIVVFMVISITYSLNGITI